MASVQQTSFASPNYDYGADLSAIERRRAMAAALQQQGLQPVEQQPVAPGQFATPISPFQMAAKLAQVYAGKRQGDKADTQQRELAAKTQKDLADVLRRGQMAMAGTPATALSEDASGNVTPPQAAVAPNMGAAAAAYLSHPQTAPMGMQMQQQELQRSMLVDALKSAGLGGQQQPASTGQPAPAYGSPGFQPGATPPPPPQQRQVPPGVDPVAWSLAMAKGDMGELAKLAQAGSVEANKPVVNRGFGLGRMVDGKYVPDQASLDQALAMERGKQGISSQYAPPHQIPMSGGQSATIFPSEQPGIIQSGQLPARFGTTPLSPTGSVPTGAPGAPRPQGGLGTLGLSQSQGDIINQARQTTAGKAVDEQFAKDYVNFTTGGAQDAAKQIAQLQDVSKALKSPSANLTGTVTGNLPNAVNAVVNPESVAMKERVEEVVQRSLRAVLGAQFTEKEGERLIARAYNPRLSEKENAIRVDRLLTQLQQGYQQKMDAARYFQKNNTLEGWKGKLPSISDFDPEAKSGPSRIRFEDLP